MFDDLSTAAKSSILDALEKGHKIEAIRIYRKETNLGLKEAKEAIDALYQRLSHEDPTRYPTVPVSSGCAGMVLILIGLCGGAGGICYFTWT